jgi:hypothetical protein
MERTVLNRRLFYTETGFIGIGPLSMKKGDVIRGFLGGQMLYVIRKEAPQQGVQKDSNKYRFLGECYVHGLMDGGALRFNEDGSVNSECIIIR